MWKILDSINLIGRISFMIAIIATAIGIFQTTLEIIEFQFDDMSIFLLILNWMIAIIGWILWKFDNKLSGYLAKLEDINRTMHAVKIMSFTRNQWKNFEDIQSHIGLDDEDTFYLLHTHLKKSLEMCKFGSGNKEWKFKSEPIKMKK